MFGFTWTDLLLALLYLLYELHNEAGSLLLPTHLFENHITVSTAESLLFARFKSPSASSSDIPQISFCLETIKDHLRQQRIRICPA